jgi:hypothetical protein
MMAIYLWINAFLYALFAAWTTLSPLQTSSSMGFEVLSNSGRSEFLVVYGGIELGFALFFALTAWNSQWQRLGVIFAVCLYAPIVLYRLITVWQFWPVKPLTLQVGALEVILLIVGVVLLFVSRNQQV